MILRVRLNVPLISSIVALLDLINRINGYTKATMPNITIPLSAIGREKNTPAITTATKIVAL